MNTVITIRPNTPSSNIRRIFSEKTNSSVYSQSFGGGKLYTIKNQKLIDTLKKVGGFSTPTNRLIMGASALAIQPWIDFSNKDVDDETRKFSVSKTIAKIIVGTATGIAVRTWCINQMKKFTKTPDEIKNLSEKEKKLATALVPDHIPHEDFAKAKRLLGKHQKALGSIAALGVMLFTNFLIDAPLTKFFTNVISKRIDVSNQNKKGEK